MTTTSIAVKGNSMSSFSAGNSFRPLCAGHRGFKSSFPENTIAAMKGAVDAGATIIETDIQVAKDGVVVICHDPNTLRCYGSLHQVSHTPYYGVLDQLRTTQAPHEKMPTFQQVAELFAENSEFDNALLMLDVKRNNEPWVIKRVVEVLQKVNPDMEFWAKRMVFGIWKLDVLQACEIDAPMIPVIHIGISRWLALKFLQHKQVIGISIHHLALKIPGGPSLIKTAKDQNRLVYSWTVNSLPVMKWAIASNLDGIVTDHPDKYSELVAGITQDEIDQVYAKLAPTAFFTWLETIILFPYNYFRVWWALEWHLFLQRFAVKEDHPANIKGGKQH